MVINHWKLGCGCEVPRNSCTSWIAAGKPASLPVDGKKIATPLLKDAVSDKPAHQLEQAFIPG